MDTQELELNLQNKTIKTDWEIELKTRLQPI